VDTPYQLLIVEDDQDTSEMLSTYFTLRGYEVRIAGWGEEAVAKCRQEPPDLILLDIRLPDIDGYEVYARVRRLFRTRQTPVIFLTERRGREDKITGLQLGAVDYMTKPFDLEELSLRVRNALRLAEHAQRINPVTNLPIGREMEEQLRPLIGRDEWAALFVRLQNLDAFGEAHGFVASNEALCAVADALGEAVAEAGNEQDFMGHLSETDLVIVTSPTQLKALREQVEVRVSRALREFTQVYTGDSEDSRPSGPLVAVGVGMLTNADLPPDQTLAIRRRLTDGDLPLETLPQDSQ